MRKSERISDDNDSARRSPFPRCPGLLPHSWMRSERCDFPPRRCRNLRSRTRRSSESIFPVARDTETRLDAVHSSRWMRTSLRSSRTFVAPEERGHGTATQILDELGTTAHEFDHDAMRPETGVRRLNPLRSTERPALSDPHFAVRRRLSAFV
jgi:hypothetical protein